MIEKKDLKKMKKDSGIDKECQGLEVNKGGRPSKIKNFVGAFKKVLENNELDVVILTDDELRITCNDLLEEDQQITDSTFEKWKAGKAKDSEEYDKFLRLYKTALVNQKRNLFTAVNKGENNWQSRSWIIERKFSDWNLRQITENTNKNMNVNHEVEDSDEFKELLKTNDLI